MAFAHAFQYAAYTIPRRAHADHTQACNLPLQNSLRRAYKPAPAVHALDKKKNSIVKNCKFSALTTHVSGRCCPPVGGGWAWGGVGWGGGVGGGGLGLGASAWLVWLVWLAGLVGWLSLLGWLS